MLQWVSLLVLSLVLEVGWHGARPSSRPPRGAEVASVPSRLIIWPKQAATVTGASMVVWIDGREVGPISNLQKQEVLELGDLALGVREFKLTRISAYAVDGAGNTQRATSDGTCSGQFLVQAYQTYYFVLVTTPNGTDFQCRIG